MAKTSGNTQTQTQIYTVVIDVKETTKALKELTAQINNVKDAQDEQTKSTKEEQEEAAKKLKVTEKQKEILAAEENSIVKLREEIKRLTKERNSLNLADEKNIPKLQQLNSQIDAHNIRIKANVDSLTSQRLGIGNYTDGIINAIPALKGLSGGISNFSSGLSAMAPGLGAATGGMGGMLKMMWGIVNNPIGLILAAIVGAVYLLYQAFSQFEPAIEAVEKSLAALHAAWVAVKDAFIGWVSGSKSFGDSFSNIGSKMEEAAKAGQKLYEVLDEIADSQKSFELQNKQLQNIIDELIIQSKDRTKTETERIALIKQANDIEKILYTEKKLRAEKELEAAYEWLHVERGVTYEELELLKIKGIQYKEDIKNKHSIREEDFNDLFKKLMSMKEIENEHGGFEEKRVNESNKLVDKREAAREKAKEAQLKRIEEETKKEKEAQAESEKLSDEQLKFHQKIIEEEKNARDELESIKLKAQQTDLDNLIISNETELQIYIDHAIALQEALLASEDTIWMEKQNKAIAGSAQMELINAQHAANRVKIEDDTTKKISAASKKLTDDTAKSDKAKKDSAIGYASSISQSYSSIIAASKELGIKSKAFAASGVIIDTASAIMKTWSSYSSMAPFGVAAAIVQTAALAATGAASLAKINSAAYAEGGLTGTKINNAHGVPVYRSNGDNILATVRTGEVILNERQQNALGGAATFKKIGVPGFAGGGFVSSTGIATSVENRSAQQNDNMFYMVETFTNAIKQQQPVLVLQDFEYVQSTRDAVQSKALVV